jgi:hypothetical protein
MRANTVAILPSNPDNATMKGIHVPYYDVVRSTLPNMPSAPDNMNDLRAQWADDALVSFEREHGDDGEHLQNFADLLCNFGHWCDRNSLQLSEALKLAAMTYSSDTEGQGGQFSA